MTPCMKPSLSHLSCPSSCSCAYNHSSEIYIHHLAFHHKVEHPSMESSRSFKQSLLKHMLVGLQAESSNTSFEKTGLLERKRSVKLTADIAMALTRGGGANWSRALIAILSEQSKNKVIVAKNLGHDVPRMTPRKNSMTCNKILKSKRIIKRSLKANARMSANRGAPASHAAMRMVRKRATVLKRLVPGGVTIGGHQALLGEALDYIVSLRAQVDVMRRLMHAVELFNTSSCPAGSLCCHQ